MVDFLVAATLNNLLVSTILAVLAWVVQRRIPSPGLANLLWAIVLIKLVTPPIVAIPAMTVPSIAGSSISTSADLHTVSPPLRFNQTDVGLASQTVESAAPANPIDEPARLMETGTQVVWIGMVVWVAVSAIRAPVLASAINSGGSLERRLDVMMNGRNWTAPAALRTVVVVMAMCVFPLGFVYAQDFEAVERRLGGAVEAGELSREQANLMMEALRHSSHSDRELESKKHRYMQFTKEIEAAVEAGKLSE